MSFELGSQAPVIERRVGRPEETQDAECEIKVIAPNATLAKDRKAHREGFTAGRLKAYEFLASLHRRARHAHCSRKPQWMKGKSTDWVGRLEISKAAVQDPRGPAGGARG